MQDAGLDLGLWIDRFDGLGEAAQAIDDSDEHVINAAIFELVKHLKLEFGALGLFDPEAQHFLAAVGAHPQRQVHGLVFDGAFVPDFQA